MSSEIALSFRDLVKAYHPTTGEAIRAVDGISLELRRGSIECLVGPTGCGKTTLLRLAAALEKPNGGSIHRGTATRVGYLTQRHTLLPWLTTRENIGLPGTLGTRDAKTAHVDTDVDAILELLGLASFGHLFPYELSGGMQQRAALGRLLSMEAACWLLDEPFSAVDERTRHRLQNLLIRLQRERDVTILFVTHSIDEAVFLADRIHVLSAGPGRIVRSLPVKESRPRDRLSPVYGRLIEEIRRELETVIEPGPYGRGEAACAIRRGNVDLTDSAVS